MEKVIEVKEVSKTFKDVKAVDCMNLEISKGDFIALLGPNGAGKTTLIEMIEGIQKPDSGEIRIFGQTWKDNPTELHNKLGIALQETRFADKLTVEETMNLFAGFYKQGKDTALNVIDQVGLSDKKKAYTKHLSGGQKQKLALGISIINDPEILLLDEPTTGLDPHARKEIWGILDRLKEKGTTIILTTHYMEEAEKLCKKIFIMNQGKIIAKGSLQELLDQNNAFEVIEFETEVVIQNQFLLKTEGSLDLSLNSDQKTGILKVKNLVKALPSFLGLIQAENIPLKSLQSRKMTLNDLFVDMTGRELNV